ncbi:HlyD family secretion protein [Herbaspirillum sp. YR522]|uniref:HlyD family secretion protein n=1 Tax=Herbaspirillum sp. YR522 TaxID=1144342 RepID=UPI00026F6D70|nr:HlyD family secretion protein [Herbaspirillum sp. YR522]EJN09982.1 multidrug resistance efflux pump [Herbaspirillum sp. YR522]
MTAISFSRRTPVLFAVAALAICGCAYGATRYLSSGQAQSTNDAFVSADYSIVSPKVSGFIATVLVQDNQNVKAGQLLATIDDREYRAALEAAQADVAQAQAQAVGGQAALVRQQAAIREVQAQGEVHLAELDFARGDVARYGHLAEQGAGTVQHAQQARSRLDAAVARQAQDHAMLESTRLQLAVLQAQVEAARAALLRARATLRRAELDLSHTRLVAPFDGVVGRRAARVGNLVSPGAALLAVVPLQRTYVIANFQENQLTRLRPGQPADIRVDTYPGRRWHGTVDSIAPATGVTFAAVAPDNATGNFTKVVQRIPVRIALEQAAPSVDLLRVGMSVEVSVDTASKG